MTNDTTTTDEDLLTHEEHLTVEAYPMACVEGECEHYDEDGDPIGEGCPALEVEVCVDCMVTYGVGPDPERWDGAPLATWPHG